MASVIGTWVPNRIMRREEAQRCDGSHVTVSDQALDP